MDDSIDEPNGYVFSSNPVAPMQTVLIQIVKVTSSVRGSLTFGVTATDPAEISDSYLPDDHEKLIQSTEYWAYKENINNEAAVGDLLAFTMKKDGEHLFNLVTQLLGCAVCMPVIENAQPVQSAQTNAS